MVGSSFQPAGIDRSSNRRLNLGRRGADIAKGCVVLLRVEQFKIADRGFYRIRLARLVGFMEIAGERRPYRRIKAVRLRPSLDCGNSLRVALQGPGAAMVRREFDKAYSAMRSHVLWQHFILRTLPYP